MLFRLGVNSCIECLPIMEFIIMLWVVHGERYKVQFTITSLLCSWQMSLNMFFIQKSHNMAAFNSC